MDSHAPSGNSADDTFILQQGGHSGIHASTESHTQDFIVTGIHNFNLTANQTTSFNDLAITLQTLGARISHASVWQTYKFNSITFYWYYAGADVGFPVSAGTHAERVGDLVYSIAPYSRDARRSTVNFQVIDPRSIPGCQVKYINARVYYPNIFGDPGEATSTTVHRAGLAASNSYFTTQPQMCVATNECPMYEVQALGPNNTLSGQVYSNAKLALLSAAGRDATIWHSFITRIDTFDPVDREIVIRGNYIAKINVTFEGIRWSTQALYQPSTEESLCTDLQTIQDGHQRDRSSFETPSKRARISHRELRDERQSRHGTALPLLPEIPITPEAILDPEYVSDKDSVAETNRTEPGNDIYSHGSC